jgi:hypothetical protein
MKKIFIEYGAGCRHGGFEEATAWLCGRREAAGQRLRIIQALEYKCRLCLGQNFFYYVNIDGCFRLCDKPMQGLLLFRCRKILLLLLRRQRKLLF